MFSIFALLCAVIPSLAQSLNDNADSIVGTYYAIQSGNESKVKVFKNADGTYTGQIFWVKNSIDPQGKKYCDIKNPDKALRTTPCDKIVLFKGLQYNAAKKQWDNAKIYDPTRGLKANVYVCFTPEGKLKIRGQIMGIGETVYWKKLD